LRRFPLGIPYPVGRLAHLFHQLQAFAGETQPACGALDQAHAQPALQRLDPLGQDRRMALQHPGSGRKRVLLRQRQQGGELIRVLAVGHFHGVR
jgi:hypothetical protein